MNIDHMRVMLELKAMQNFNTKSVQSNSIFQELLSGLLTEEETLQIPENVSEKPGNTSLPINRPSFPPMSLLNAQKSSSTYDDLIDKAAQMYNLPAKLIKSIIKQESNFDANAVSESGASGLMQLMPKTARSLGVENVFDPAQNILGGTKYIRDMLDKYDGNVEMALAAYNAGPGNVDKYGGIPPFKETHNYVRKVTNSFYG